MINTKKLIVSFLILSLGISSFAFILSYITTQKNNNTIATNTIPSPINNNAFVTNSISSSTENDIINNPNNITGAILSDVLANLIDTNPNGPITNSSGTISAIQPDKTKILSDLMNSPSIKNINIPDWETEANNQKLNLISSSTDAIITYFRSFNDILNTNIVKNNIQDILSQTNNTNQDSLLLAESSINNSLSQALQIPTPPILENFQKSFIKTLVYSKNLLQLTTNNTNDPAMVSIVLNIENSKYQSSINDFNNQVKDINSKLLSINYNKSNIITNKSYSFITNILGVKTAYAQIPISDLVGNALKVLGNSGTWAVVTKQVLGFAKTYALQQLKNYIINEAQNKVLSWVNGSGSGIPRFLTSWADTFVNVAVAAANAEINKISPNICPSFAPIISASLSISGNSGGFSNGFQSCPMSINQMNAFAGDFSQGGWDAYFKMLQPNGNFYSTYFDAADAVSAAATNAQNAAQIKATANQGYTGTQVCSDGSDPNGSRQVCINNDTGYEDTAANGKCLSFETLMTVSNGGLCADGSEPKITTPGQVTAQMTTQALGIKLNLVISAQDVTGLLETLADSLVSKVIDAGVNGIIGAKTKEYTMPILPTQLISCSPDGQTIEQSTPITFIADGGAYGPNNESPIYTWTAPSSTNPSTTGPVLNTAFPDSGKYKVTVTASTDRTSATCTVNVNPLSNYVTPITITP